MAELVGDDAYSLNPNSDGLFHPLPDDGWKKNWVQTASHMKAMKGIVTVDTGTAHWALNAWFCFPKRNLSAGGGRMPAGTTAFAYLDPKNTTNYPTS